MTDSPAPPPRPRVGVSLLELMVAVAVLGGGLLALAGPSAALARALRDAALDLRAAALAGAIAERHAACLLPPTGDTLDGPLRARWITADTGEPRELALLVADTARDRPGRAFAAAALCPARGP